MKLNCERFDRSELWNYGFLFLFLLGSKYNGKYSTFIHIHYTYMYYGRLTYCLLHFEWWTVVKYGEYAVNAVVKISN